MPPNGEVAYLDSSALVKLVVQEPESGTLTDFLAEWPVIAACALARVEVVRAVRAHGSAAIDRALQVLNRVTLLRLDDSLLDAAANLGPPRLRSLDAIHLATALTLGRDLGVLVTYDERMRDAGEHMGLPMAAPGWESG